jgi:chromosome segregation ATPase
MLKQMAAALEAEAAGLCSKATSFEEDESLLGREIEKHWAELHRLSARLESLRSERDELLERIEKVTEDARALREEVSNQEEEQALESLTRASCGVVGSGSRARRLADHPRRRWRDD